MDHDEKKESGGENGSGAADAEKKMVADLEALLKCLEEKTLDNARCKSLIEAFKAQSRTGRPTGPISIRTGSWTDV